MASHSVNDWHVRWQWKGQILWAGITWRQFYANVHGCSGKGGAVWQGHQYSHFWWWANLPSLQLQSTLKCILWKAQC